MPRRMRRTHELVTRPFWSEVRLINPVRVLPKHTRVLGQGPSPFTSSEKECSMRIGSAISLARNNLGLTKKELAENIGLSPSAITRIEKGERSLSLQTAQDIARALGLRLSQLVTIAESILKPEDEIKELQRKLLLSIQPILSQRSAKNPRPRNPAARKRSSSKPLAREPRRTAA